MGIFVCVDTPTRCIHEAANHSGTYTHLNDRRRFPKVQIVTVAETYG